MAALGGFGASDTMSRMGTTVPIASLICGILLAMQTVSHSTMVGATIMRSPTTASPKNSASSQLLVPQNHASAAKLNLQDLIQQGIWLNANNVSLSTAQHKRIAAQLA
jgi:hypothetical protein